MAEYCKSCAYKLGMVADKAPLLCEGCGKNIPYTNWFVKLLNRLK